MDVQSNTSKKIYQTCLLQLLQGPSYGATLRKTLILTLVTFDLDLMTWVLMVLSAWWFGLVVLQVVIPEQTESDFQKSEILQRLPNMQTKKALLQRDQTIHSTLIPSTCCLMRILCIHFNDLFGRVWTKHRKAFVYCMKSVEAQFFILAPPSLEENENIRL